MHQTPPSFLLLCYAQVVRPWILFSHAMAGSRRPAASRRSEEMTVTFVHVCLRIHWNSFNDQKPKNTLARARKKRYKTAAGHHSDCGHRCGLIPRMTASCTEQQRCFTRLVSSRDREPTHHVCVIGVAARDDEALRETCFTFGKVSSIERNAKVGLQPLILADGGRWRATVLLQHVVPYVVYTGVAYVSS